MRVGIALGSNVGDRLGYLRKARERLFDLHEGRTAPLFSGIYETEPVDCEPGTESFLNAVIEIESELSPVDLLDYGQRIEQECGRLAIRPKNSPRTIDVDLLYAGNHRIGTDRLELPHPRLLERRFVLIPLCEIRPDLVLPGDKETVSATLERLASPEAPAELLVSQW